MEHNTINYQELNSKTIDGWVEDGWEWGKPISHETFAEAQAGKWDILLSPTKPVPHEWFGDLKGKKLLGLASGGGQQIPVFSALGAECTVLDYSAKQLESEAMVAEREGYQVRIVKADMTKPLPFEDEEFDLIFHPISNCYVEDMQPIFKECYRVLKKGGRLLGGFDNGMNFVLDEEEKEFKNILPFNPLKNPENMREMEETCGGVQFSHTVTEIIDGQLKAGFVLEEMYEDTNGYGKLDKYNVPAFVITKSKK